VKPREREALYLKALGYSYQEIARLTDSTYTAVDRRITEGRAVLRGERRNQHHAKPAARAPGTRPATIRREGAKRRRRAPTRARRLILRDVLGFSAREVAESLETTVGSVNGALHRARRAVEERLPDESQQATLRALGDDRLRELVEAYMDAWERADVEAVVAMLVEDATIAMPPMALWYRGRDAIAIFLTKWALQERWRFVPTRANGQLAFGTYSWDAEKGLYVASAVDVLTLRGAQVETITAFVSPEVFRSFGLPDELAA
jgi:RNA polymerase sigma-70 factor, ECF subfamily